MSVEEIAEILRARWRWLAFCPPGVVLFVLGVEQHTPVPIAIGMFAFAWPAIRHKPREPTPGGALPQALELEVDEIEAELRFGLECLWVEYADDKLTISELESCAERQYAMYDAEIEKVDGRRRLWAIRENVTEPHRPSEVEVREVLGELYYFAKDAPPHPEERVHVDTSRCECEACRKSRSSPFEKPKMERYEC